MSEHKEMPGKGVMYFEPPEKRKHPKAPDYSGYIVLEMDYRAGDKLKLSAWQHPTSFGYNLLSLSENNWSRKQKETPREVQSGYQRQKNDYAYRAKDSDIPF